MTPLIPRVAACLLAALPALALGCAEPAPQPRRAPVAPAAEPGRWTRPLPMLQARGMVTGESLVVVSGRGSRDGAQARARVLAAVDADEGGALRWRAAWPSSDAPGGPDDDADVEVLDIHPSGGVLVRRGATLAALRADDGAWTWRWTPAPPKTAPDAAAPAAEVTVHAISPTRVVVGVGRLGGLVMLDRATGDAVGRWPLPGLMVLAAHETPQGWLALASDVHLRDSALPHLRALRLLPSADPSADPSAAPASATPLWDAEIAYWPLGSVAVYDHLALLTFDEHEVWALRLSDGQRLWRAVLPELPGALIASPPHLLLHRTDVLQDAAGARRVLRIDAFDPSRPPSPPHQRWRVDLPSGYPLAGVEPIDDAASLAFGATGDQVFILDLSRGLLRWNYVLHPTQERPSWSHASADPRAVFLILQDSTGPRLLRVPVLDE